MVLAHAGDVVTSLIMVGPVFLVGAWLGIQILRGRGAGEPEERDALAALQAAKQARDNDEDDEET